MINNIFNQNKMVSNNSSESSNLGKKFKELTISLGIAIEKTKKGTFEILLGTKKIKKRVFGRAYRKLYEISRVVPIDKLNLILELVKNKEKLMDIIDASDAKKMISLFNYCESNQLAQYINSEKRNPIIDVITKTPRDEIEKLAKQINKTRIPLIIKEKIFI